jgi:hypothetical protein
MKHQLPDHPPPPNGNFVGHWILLRRDISAADRREALLLKNTQT